MNKYIILDSERSDGCIDFTMIIINRNNASISTIGGSFRGQNQKFSNSLKRNREKQKKSD
ncbi:hypothetical protein FWK35_00036314 [Aphis craccivora]|uniref:Uncharacterized protein n=1 Tax=Aphis craccivora TaxID=307492 RepID=A0A6G0VX56_APHCR|nr:hypothetical protein FWK35_00036314 [Aphis craccivora]